MGILKITRKALFFFFFVQIAYSQQADSTKNISTFSGSIGITNNGFAIIPTFSLNSPAAIINLSFRKNKFSIDPDFRLVPDGSKGGLLFWFRYRIIEKKKFSFRVGAHPAFSFIHRTVTDNGTSTKITEMLRFAAFEAVPNYQIKPNWGVGAMYLQGHGLQNHGPQQTDVLFLNTSITNIKLGKELRFHFIPVVYFLNTDGFTGQYVTATSILAHKKSPVSLQYTFNKTLKSNIPGNQDFMWNVTLSYAFSKSFRKV